MEYLNQIALAPLSVGNRKESKIDVYRRTKAPYCNFYGEYSSRFPGNANHIYLPNLRYGTN